MKSPLQEASGEWGAGDTQPRTKRGATPGNEKQARKDPPFARIRLPTFPFEAGYAWQYYSWSFWSTGDTEVPGSERKAKSVLSALAQGHRGADAHPRSRGADRAAAQENTGYMFQDECTLNPNF